MSIFRKLERFAYCTGNVDCNSKNERTIVSRFERFPSSVGSGPPSGTRLTYNVLRLVKSPNSVGMDPLNKCVSSREKVSGERNVFQVRKNLVSLLSLYQNSQTLASVPTKTRPRANLIRNRPSELFGIPSTKVAKVCHARFRWDRS